MSLNGGGGGGGVTESQGTKAFFLPVPMVISVCFQAVSRLHYDGKVSWLFKHLFTLSCLLNSYLQLQEEKEKLYSENK